MNMIIFLIEDSFHAQIGMKFQRKTTTMTSGGVTVQQPTGMDGGLRIVTTPIWTNILQETDIYKYWINLVLLGERV